MPFGRPLLILVLFLNPQPRHFTLPASAIVTAGPLERDARDPNSEDCKDYSLTEKQIREQFRTYHKVSGWEDHDYYLYFPCQIQGSITYHGKTYQWRSQPGNTMVTNWPDGVWKILGGKHSEDPSAGEKP